MVGALRSESVIAPGQTGDTSRPGRVLAIDYGRKRVGLALSDELRLVAQPLDTMVRKNRRDDLRRLRNVVRENQVKHVIVGYPIHLNGEKSEMAIEVSRFAARLRKELGLDVDLVDERLTSWEADQIASSRRADRRADTDDIAAALFLREYLDRKTSSTSMPRSGSQ